MTEQDPSAAAGDGSDHKPAATASSAEPAETTKPATPGTAAPPNPKPAPPGTAPAAGVRLFIVHAPEDAWFVDGFLLAAMGLPDAEVLVSEKLEPGRRSPARSSAGP